MTSKELWATPQLRASCIRNINNSTSELVINSVNLEEQIFESAQNEEEYRKLMVQLEIGLRRKEAEMKQMNLLNQKLSESSKQIIDNQPSSNVDVLQNLEQLSSAETPRNAEYAERVEKCTRNLQKLITEGPTLKTTLENIEKFKHMLRILSNNENSVPIDALDKCEREIEKHGKVDEVDLMILECEKDLGVLSAGNSSAGMQHGTNISGDSSETLSALGKLSIGSIQPIRNENANAQIPEKRIASPQINQQFNNQPNTNQQVAMTQSVNSNETELIATLKNIARLNTLQNQPPPLIAASNSLNESSGLINVASFAAFPTAQVSTPNNEHQNFQPQRIYTAPAVDRLQYNNQQRTMSNQQQVPSNIIYTTPPQGRPQRVNIRFEGNILSYNLAPQIRPQSADNSRERSNSSGATQTIRGRSQSVDNRQENAMSNQELLRVALNRPETSQNQPQPNMQDFRSSHHQQPPATSSTLHRQPPAGLSQEETWRKDAREALMKSIMQIEETAYCATKSKEQYYSFFQKIFIFARKTLDSPEFNPESSTDATKEAAMIQMKKLLPNEPTDVQEIVAKEWSDIDARIEKISSTSNDTTDQAFDKINLQPDSFENQMSTFIKTLQFSEK